MRRKVAQEKVIVDKQRSMISLFSMLGTDPELKRKFMQLSQLRALGELEGHKETSSEPVEEVGDDFPGATEVRANPERQLWAPPRPVTPRRSTIVRSASDVPSNI